MRGCFWSMCFAGAYTTTTSDAPLTPSLALAPALSRHTGAWPGVVPLHGSSLPPCCLPGHLRHTQAGSSEVDQPHENRRALRVTGVDAMLRVVLLSKCALHPIQLEKTSSYLCFGLRAALKCLLRVHFCVIAEATQFIIFSPLSFSTVLLKWWAIDFTLFPDDPIFVLQWFSRKFILPPSKYNGYH